MKLGWKIKTLGEVLLKTETVNPAQSPDEEFDYIDVSSVSNETYVVAATQRLKGREAPSRARRRVRAGDVLLATIRPTLKRIAVIPPELDGQVCSTGFFVLRPRGEIDHRFLFYSLFTEQFMGAMESLQKGASYPAVTDAEVRAQPISYPTLVEQRRIVAILDEAFDGIATAKANAENALQGARELYDGYLEAAFAQLEGTAPIEKLGKLCEFEGGSQPPKSEFVYAPRSGYVRFLQIRDFGTDRHETYIPEARKNRLCTESDILIGRYGASVGKILTGKAGAYNVALMKTLPNLSMLDPEFFHLYLTSGAFQSRLMNVAARSAQDGFSKEDIFGFPVPLPPLSQQQAIVEQIDPVYEESQRLAAIYERKVTALDELKKSLLHQAFTGQLTSKTTEQQLEAVA